MWREQQVISKEADRKRQLYKHFGILLFLGGALVIMILLLFGRGQDIGDTYQTAKETITFLKGTCQRYDNYHIGIDTDARQNLLDKTKVLKEYMTEEFLNDTKALSQFAKLQNLTGVWILDQNLKTTAQTDIRGLQSETIWRKQISTESKKNIITNSNKTFTEKVKIGNRTYYVAMVSRKDKKGLILCYRIADELRTDQYNTSFSVLMKNNTFHKNPKILITDNKNILSTNASYLKNTRSIKDIPELNVKWSDHQLTKIKFGNKTLYGMRQVYGRYYIYVCYESSEIFSNLIPIVTIGVAIYIFCAMTMLLIRQNMKEHNLIEQAKQFQIYQEDLKKTARDTELANAAKTTFLRRMSHDIRTPINGIRGMATLAKHHLKEPEKQSEYIEKIITSSDYLLDLVNDVLQMNKLESGKIYLENKSFDMRLLVKEIVELCKIQADEQDIKLNLKELKTEHAHLIGSPLHLRQIAQNLITNAIRYNHAGGTVDITWKEIGFDGEKASYEFICADTGNGMSEEFQKHLYEPFAQENDNGRSTYSGTGLGLPIVKQLIEYMGGSITFTSKKGKGTTFVVKLELDIDDHYQREYQEDVSLETISIEGTRILLVEDNEINMQIARELLETNGAVITEAYNGREAVEIFEHTKEGEFDTILMDIMMPEMDGLDATRYIRSLKREDAKEIPIFAMTANAFIEDINQSKEAGMNEHFSKPLDMEQVIKAIWRYKKR